MTRGRLVAVVLSLLAVLGAGTVAANALVTVPHIRSTVDEYQQGYRDAFNSCP